MKLLIKKDKNGNKTISVKPIGNRSFSIQTNGNLPKTHANGICDESEKEVIQYLLDTMEIAKLSQIVLSHSNWTGYSLLSLIELGRIHKEDLKSISSFIKASLGDPKSIDEFRLHGIIARYISK